MIKVILTRGLPASGKDTWAEALMKESPNSYKRINKDMLRDMLDANHHSYDMEKFILKVRDSLILLAISEGKHVIISDTNFSEKHFNRIKQLVHGKAEVVIQDFTDVPLETCIKRDLKRTRSVGEAVIRQMHKQFLVKTEVYTEDQELPKAIIVDIDGTLALTKGRSPFDWSKVKEDAVNDVVKNIVNAYNKTVIVFSGRDSVCKKETEEWLQDNGIIYHQLYMREAGNNEKDSVVKRRLFEEHIRGKYFIEYVLDDRQQVVDMWRAMGLTCLQVAEGNF